MTRIQLTEVLLRLMEDDTRNFVDPQAFMQSLDDQSFDNFARGYLLGMSYKLKHYEQLFGVKLTESPAPKA